jgi:uncharacterized membrane protein YqaE (UPF0057 family)
MSTTAAGNGAPVIVTGTTTTEERRSNKQALAGQKATTRNVDPDCLFIIKIILAFVFPPLAVALERGCDGQTILNIILTIIGWIPGVAHALFIILHCGQEVTEEGEVIRAESTTNGNAGNV